MARLVVVEDLVGPSLRGRGGFAMHVLQAREGLRRLEHDVLFLEFFAERPAHSTLSSFCRLSPAGGTRGEILRRRGCSRTCSPRPACRPRRRRVLE